MYTRSKEQEQTLETIRDELSRKEYMHDTLNLLHLLIDRFPTLRFSLSDYNQSVSIMYPQTMIAITICGWRDDGRAVRYRIKDLDAIITLLERKGIPLRETELEYRAKYFSTEIATDIKENDNQLAKCMTNQEITDSIAGLVKAIAEEDKATIIILVVALLQNYLINVNDIADKLKNK